MRIDGKKEGELTRKANFVKLTFLTYQNKYGERFFLDIQKLLLKYYNVKCINGKTPTSKLILPKIKDTFKLNKYHLSRVRKNALQ